jgi:hypothetical protein
MNTTARILPDLKSLMAKSPVESPAESPAQELARLRAENATLKANATAKAKGNPVRLKVTEKGGLSIYGLGRFPVTLYKGQWQRLIAFVPEIEAALPSLRDKGDE